MAGAAVAVDMFPSAVLLALAGLFVVPALVVLAPDPGVTE